ncbi:type 3 dihydrofolate reductase [Candidatus Methylospira mobilis]|uniref:Dihydrofolate reductase n=1 Tax=Candidatus Methylospira mobilis TaxID=1808979 RepID=A0A5Q0BIU4_9GAMM|nr:type 3 dihydrofolate reductase [Candidatus Methylospira mobilis]QFY42121.1 type 3 dihydrofolate reductase [Candidatus Methylospira mobilis]
MKISLIVAMSANRVIGIDNRMPWHLPADLQRFRAITWGKPILMGRKTHESIGRPLPGRENIVLTSDSSYRAEGCVVVNSLQQGLAVAARHPEAMIIGGSTLYQASLPIAERLYLTHIDRSFEGDTSFPEVDWTEWREVEHQSVTDDDSVSFGYAFMVWDRKL